MRHREEDNIDIAGVDFRLVEFAGRCIFVAVEREGAGGDERFVEGILSLRMGLVVVLALARVLVLVALVDRRDGRS